MIFPHQETLCLTLDLSNPFQLYPTNFFSAVNIYLTQSIFAQGLCTFFFSETCFSPKNTVSSVIFHTYTLTARRKSKLFYSIILVLSFCLIYPPRKCRHAHYLHCCTSCFIHPFCPCLAPTVAHRLLPDVSLSHPKDCQSDLAKTQSQSCLSSA